MVVRRVNFQTNNVLSLRGKKMIERYAGEKMCEQSGKKFSKMLRMVK